MVKNRIVAANWVYKTPEHAAYRTKNISVGLKRRGVRRSEFRVIALTSQKEELVSFLEILKKELDKGFDPKKFGSVTVSLEKAKRVFNSDL